MIDLRAVATLGIGYGRRQIAAIGLAIAAVLAKPDSGRMGGGEPLRMELHPLHIRKKRQREEDALLLLMLG